MNRPDGIDPTKSTQRNRPNEIDQAMIFSGIADEAGADIDTQIRAHKELGWEYIELRNVNGIQFTDVPENDFVTICQKLDEAGIKVSAFASGIANWACKITDPFEKSTETLKRTIPRMQRLGTKFIRVMSYPNNGLADSDWRDEAVRRMQNLGNMAEDAGIVLMVENCDGWASTSAENYARYFEMVDSPAVQAVYDTGNPASHGQINTWEWYRHAKPHIGYIHIKDHTGPGTAGKGDHVWPNEGAGCVEETLVDLLRGGYEGFISIEPHLEAVIHEGEQVGQEEAAYRTYVEYGRRLVKLLETVMPVFLILLFFSGPTSSHAQDAIDIGSRLELFVDHYLIDNLDGAELKLHPPVENPSTHPPSAGHYATIIKDGPIYRMYNRAGLASFDGDPREITEYFESHDGIRWKRPNLGIYEIRGSYTNNVILANDPPYSHNFSPFLDTKPGIPEDERFKALAGTEKSGLVAFVSDDGIHWRKKSEKPVFTNGMFDSRNVSFWSEAEQLYVCYFRSSNYAALNVIPTGPEEMSIYVRGRRYTLRTDGFVSVHAGFETGEMLTKPFIFSGDELTLNLSTSAGGRAVVEIQDLKGNPLPGFSLDDADPLTGDRIAFEASWNSESDVSELAGQPIRLRFVLKEADLYSMRFE